MPILYGQVGGIPNTSLADGGNFPALQGKAGEIIAAELHGKWFTAAYRGRVYISAPLIAGITIPVNTTTAATFTIYNPVASSTNLELISLDIGWPAAATSVVATILGTVSNQTPTAVTANTNPILPGLLGGSFSPQAKIYTAATVVASTSHIPLLQVTSTADAMVASHYEFDGKIILPPGWIMTLTSTPVQTGVAMPGLCWAEWPI